MAGYTLNFRVLMQYSGLFLEGVLLTVKICVGSMIISFFLGMLLAVMRQSKSRAARFISTVWVEVLRNTPFLIQLFFFYYGLPQLGIYVDALVVAIIALGINSSAPNCEVIRSGLMRLKRAIMKLRPRWVFQSSKPLRVSSSPFPCGLRSSRSPATSSTWS